MGAGAAGSALVRALTRAGYVLSGITSRSAPSAAALASDLGVENAGVQIETFVRPALLILAVPDDVIGDVAGELADRADDWSQSIVFHLSGARPAAALAAVRRAGADVASFHPMVSLHAGSPTSVFHGARVNIEGDASAIAVGTRLATAIGAVPFEVDPDTKLAIHLAASIASNYVVTLVAVATELLEREGIAPEDFGTLLGPLVRSTVQNIAFDAPMDALTGPVSRSDMVTVRAHLECLEKRHREFLPLIANLVAETTRRAVKHGRVSLESGEEMLHIVHEIIESSHSGRASGGSDK